MSSVSAASPEKPGKPPAPRSRDLRAERIAEVMPLLARSGALELIPPQLVQARIVPTLPQSMQRRIALCGHLSIGGVMPTTGAPAKTDGVFCGCWRHLSCARGLAGRWVAELCGWTEEECLGVGEGLQALDLVLPGPQVALELGWSKEAVRGLTAFIEVLNDDLRALTGGQKMASDQEFPAIDRNQVSTVTVNRRKLSDQDFCRWMVGRVRGGRGVATKLRSQLSERAQSTVGERVLVDLTDGDVLYVIHPKLLPASGASGGRLPTFDLSDSIELDPYLAMFWLYLALTSLQVKRAQGFGALRSPRGGLEHSREVYRASGLVEDALDAINEPAESRWDTWSWPESVEDREVTVRAQAMDLVSSALSDGQSPSDEDLAKELVAGLGRYLDLTLTPERLADWALRQNGVVARCSCGRLLHDRQRACRGHRRTRSY